MGIIGALYERGRSRSQQEIPSGDNRGIPPSKNEGWGTRHPAAPGHDHIIETRNLVLPSDATLCRDALGTVRSRRNLVERHSMFLKHVNNVFRWNDLC
jgi:hypothetical protein